MSKVFDVELLNEQKVATKHLEIIAHSRIEAVVKVQQQSGVTPTYMKVTYNKIKTIKQRIDELTKAREYLSELDGVDHAYRTLTDEIIRLTSLI